MYNIILILMFRVRKIRNYFKFGKRFFANYVGKEFKKLNRGKFIVLTNKNDKYQTNKLYKEKLNFVPRKLLNHFINYKKDNIFCREIVVHNDANIEVNDKVSEYYENKFTTDKFKLKRKVKIEKLPELKNTEFCKDIFSGDWTTIRYINSPTTEMYRGALKNSCKILEHIEQTDELCRFAIEQDYRVLKYVKNQTKELCELAVKDYGGAIKYVENQTEELCELAVRDYGGAIKYVENQTDKLSILAIKNGWPTTVKDLGNPSSFVVMEILKDTEKDSWGTMLRYVSEKAHTEQLGKRVLGLSPYLFKFLKNQTPSICLMAVDMYGPNIQYVKNPTEKIALLAIKRNCLLSIIPESVRTEKVCLEAFKNSECCASLQYVDVKNRTPELCREAVKQSGWELKYVEKQTEKMCIEAIESHAYVIEYVKNQTVNLCKIAIRKVPESIKYIRDQTDELCKLAISLDCGSFQYIRDITYEHTILAIKKVLKRLENGQYIFAHNWQIYRAIKPEYITDEMLKLFYKTKNFKPMEPIVEFVKCHKDLKILKFLYTAVRGEKVSDFINDPLNINNLGPISRYNELTEIYKYVDKSKITEELIYEIAKRVYMNMNSYIDREYHTEELYLKIVREKPFALRGMYPELITKEMKMLAIKGNPSIVQFIENPTFEMVLEATHRGKLEYVNSISDKELCERLVRHNYKMFKHVNWPYQTEQMCLFAVKKDPHMLEHVHYELITDEMCSEAIKRVPKTIKYLYGTMCEEKPEICYKLVRINPYLIRYIDEPNDELCTVAVEQDPNVIRYIKNQTDKICKLAVKKNPFALKYVKKQTLELCREAVGKDSIAKVHIRGKKMRKKFKR